MERRLAKAQANAREQCQKISRSEFHGKFCADYQVLRRRNLLDQFWDPAASAKRGRQLGSMTVNFDVLPNFDFSAIMDFFFDQAKALLVHLKWPRGHVHRVFH